MTQFTYRLQPLLEQKQEGRKEAERELIRREQELDAQLAVLHTSQTREKKLVEKRDQFQRQMLTNPDPSQALTGREVMERAEYVKALKLEIEDAKSEVLSQGLVVEQCEARMRESKERVEDARREVEVLTKHRSKQEERFLRECQAKEELALDEIGNLLYATRRR
jgi:flagellar biosynthesis chaperone FliJ